MRVLQPEVEPEVEIDLGVDQLAWAHHHEARLQCTPSSVQPTSPARKATPTQDAGVLALRAVTNPTRFRTTFGCSVGSERRGPTLKGLPFGIVAPCPATSHFAGEVKGVAKSSVPSIATAMRYHDVGAASDWLCAAFAFNKHLVATSEAGVVHYAQLTFGDAMFMLATVRDGALDRYMKQPHEIGGAETQSCYLLVGDADAHYARAKAAGAEIILDIQDDDFGGRSYACRDPEGHIWNVGTYDPWQGKRAAGLHAASAGQDRRGPQRLAMAFAILAGIAISGVTGGMYVAMTREQRTLGAAAKEVEDRASRIAQERLSTEAYARATAEQAAREATGRLSTEANARATAEQAAREATGSLDRERIAREAAENEARAARQELDRLHDAKRTDTTEADLDRERAARETAERAANQARELLNSERNAKNAALRAAAHLRKQLIQVQNAKQQAAEGYVDPEGTTAEPKSAPTRAKKQKAKTPSSEE